MKKTMTTGLCGLVGAALLVVPVMASAQSADAAYCAALVTKYESYLDMNSTRSQQPQSVDARVGVERCKAGDPRGIPSIEKALKNARIDLPARS
jgi:hypothetical protein